MGDNQLALGFEHGRRERVAKSHRQQLTRVSDRIEGHVCNFLRECGKAGLFHMQELTEYVVRHAQVAPDSPGRVMRDLRKRGVIGVELVSRSKSQYRVKYVARRKFQ